MQVIHPKDTALRRPCWPPTEIDWMDFKPLISHMYIDKGFKLDKIRAHLEIYYGFKASERMYKARLKRWKLKKYLRKEDKQAVAQMLDVYRRKGVEAPMITLDGRPVPLHVIRRYCRREGVFGETCDDLPYAPPARIEDCEQIEAAEHVELSTQSPFPPPSISPAALDLGRMRVTSQLPSEIVRLVIFETGFDVVHSILKLTSQYLHWHLGSDLADNEFESSSRPSAVTWNKLTRMAMHARSFWESFVRGLELLEEDEHEEAWDAINEGCEMAETVLQEQHRGLLKLICMLFSDYRWGRHPDLHSTLFRYLSQMSARVLGETHPLSTITRLCHDPAVFQHASPKMLSVSLDIFKLHLCDTTAEVGQLERASCDILRLHGDFTAAENAANTLISKCQKIHGINSEDTRRALRRLAHIYIDQENYQLAEQIYYDVIRRGQQELGQDFPDDSCVYAYQNLAKIFQHRGDVVEAEKYWQAAYDGAVYLFGVDDDDTSYCRKHLDCFSARRHELEMIHPEPGRDASLHSRNAGGKVLRMGRACFTGQYDLKSSSWSV